MAVFSAQDVVLALNVLNNEPLAGRKLSEFVGRLDLFSYALQHMRDKVSLDETILHMLAEATEKVSPGAAVDLLVQLESKAANLLPQLAQGLDASEDAFVAESDVSVAGPLQNMLTTLCNLAQAAGEDWQGSQVACKLLPILATTYCQRLLAGGDAPAGKINLLLPSLALLWLDLSQSVCCQAFSSHNLQKMLDLARIHNQSYALLCLGLLRAPSAWEHACVLYTTYSLLRHPSEDVVSLTCKAWLSFKQTGLSEAAKQAMHSVIADRGMGCTTMAAAVARCYPQQGGYDSLSLAVSVDVFTFLHALATCGTAHFNATFEGHVRDDLRALHDSLLKALETQVRHLKPQHTCDPAQQQLCYQLGSCIPALFGNVHGKAVAAYLLSNPSINAILSYVGKGAPMDTPFSLGEKARAWAVVLLCKKGLLDANSMLPPSWHASGCARLLARVLHYTDDRDPNQKDVVRSLLKLVAYPRDSMDDEIRGDLLTAECVQQTLAACDTELVRLAVEQWARERDGPGAALVMHFMDGSCQLLEAPDGTRLLPDLLPAMGFLLAVNYDSEQDDGSRIEVTPQTCAMAVTMLLSLKHHPEVPGKFARRIPIVANGMGLDLQQLVTSALQSICDTVLNTDATMQCWEHALQGLLNQNTYHPTDVTVRLHMKLLGRTIREIDDQLIAAGDPAQLSAANLMSAAVMLCTR